MSRFGDNGNNCPHGGCWARCSRCRVPLLKVGNRVERADGERLYYQGIVTAVIADGVCVDWCDVRGVFTRYTHLESPADLRLSR